MVTFTIEVLLLENVWEARILRGHHILAQSIGHINRVDALRAVMLAFAQQVARDGEDVFG